MPIGQTGGAQGPGVGGANGFYDQLIRQLTGGGGNFNSAIAGFGAGPYQGPQGQGMPGTQQTMQGSTPSVAGQQQGQGFGGGTPQSGAQPPLSIPSFSHIGSLPASSPGGMTSGSIGGVMGGPVGPTTNIGFNRQTGSLWSLPPMGGVKGIR